MRVLSRWVAAAFALRRVDIFERCSQRGFLCVSADQCMFVDKPSVAVRDHLQENLKGQERAIEAVVGAIEAWEFSYVC